MSESIIALPIATVQPDFGAIVDDVFSGLVPEDKFWLSCYRTGDESVHGKVQLALNERDRNLLDFGGQGGVTFEKGSDDKYFASCEKLGISKTHIAVPMRSYSEFLPRTQSSSYRAISAFDIAPDGSQFAVGYGDGSVYVVPTTSTTATATSSSRPHLSSVTSLQFFPSSRVLLTTGVDFTLTILSADLPSTPPTERDGPRKVSPVRALKGHSRAVTAAAIISRGRNVLSGAKDGTVRLWDVSSGTQIRMLGAQKYTAVLSMAAGDRGEAVFAEPPDGERLGEAKIPLSVDPREVDTADKLVFCGLADGSVEAFDLSTKLSVLYMPGKSSSGLHALAYSPRHSLVATGSSTGVVRVHDTRSLSKPLVAFQRNNASIEDVAWVAFEGGDVGLAIGTEDGLPYVAHVRPEGPSVCAELAGPDCDAVRSVRVHAETGAVWTAGDDGVVRRYREL